MINRLYLLLEWHDFIYNEWNIMGLTKEINEKYPYVLMYRQANIIAILQELILIIIRNNEFSCKNSIVNRMYKEYYDAMSNDLEKNFFYYIAK